MTKYHIHCPNCNADFEFDKLATSLIEDLKEQIDKIIKTWIKEDETG